MLKAKNFILICIPALILLIPLCFGIMFPRESSKKSYNFKIKMPFESNNNSKQIIISFLDISNGKTTKINLEEYLPGVLAAEMPAEYEPEALKAQAVAARSYILSQLKSPSPEHPFADVCNDPTHCKAYLDKEKAMNKWQAEDKFIYWEKLCSAVNSTSGEYMTYEGEVIEAFFFANSGGKTEASKDVWGGNRPYLNSVPSEWDFSSPDVSSKKTIPVEEFWNTLIKANSAVIPSHSTSVIDDINHTKGGSVAEITLGGQKFKGTEIRSLFGLNSAKFNISCENNSIIFSVLGRGHGVGMSQFGANCMAKSGQNYTEILAHYYTNIQIVKF